MGESLILSKLNYFGVQMQRFAEHSCNDFDTLYISSEIEYLFENFLFHSYERANKTCN